MLISERPSYVTILCLVRDAVARLPNGEGTRVDVSIFCILSFLVCYFSISQVFFHIQKLT